MSYPKLRKLQEFRRICKLSQQETAELLDLQQPMISFLENGHRQLDATNVARISKITGIPKHQLRPDLYEE